MTGPQSYAIHGGYDPDDGLDDKRGRWMFDDERHCQVWVRTDQAAAEVESDAA